MLKHKVSYRQRSDNETCRYSSNLSRHLFITLDDIIKICIIRMYLHIMNSVFWNKLHNVELDLIY